MSRKRTGVGAVSTTHSKLRMARLLSLVRYLAQSPM
jgi:hypothetical protein